VNATVQKNRYGIAVGAQPSGIKYAMLTAQRVRRDRIDTLATNLSSREVQEAIEESISRSLFARGERLHRVARLADDI
jgi:hypothetical protein